MDVKTAILGRPLTGENEVPREKPLPVPLSPPQMPHLQGWSGNVV